MSHFPLTETESGIAKSSIVTVILVGVVKIVSAFYIIAAAFFKKVSVGKMSDIGFDGIGRDIILP